jgi:hypothetical protein
VKFRHLLPGLGAVGRAELFLAQSALRLGQSGSVFRGMAGIADTFTLVSDKQVFQAQINAGHVRCDRQLTGFKLAQAAHKVAASRVFGNRYGTRCAGQFAAPPNIQRGFAFGQIQLAVPVFKGRTGELRRLTVPLAFECWVLGAAFKEIFKGGLLMTQTLLQRNRADFAQKRQLGVFLHPRQLRVGFNIADFDLLLIERIGAPTKDRIVNETHTAKRPGQNLLLLRRWVKAVFVGAFSHISHNRQNNVRWQTG